MPTTVLATKEAAAKKPDSRDQGLTKVSNNRWGKENRNSKACIHKSLIGELGPFATATQQLSPPGTSQPLLEKRFSVRFNSRQPESRHIHLRQPPQTFTQQRASGIPSHCTFAEQLRLKNPSKSCCPKNQGEAVRKTALASLPLLRALPLPPSQHPPLFKSYNDQPHLIQPPQPSHLQSPPGASGVHRVQLPKRVHLSSLCMLFLLLFPFVSQRCWYFDDL